MTNNGEVYHRVCKQWTTSIACGKCRHCGVEIPDATLRVAREDVAERERAARSRDATRKRQELLKRLDQLGEG